MTVSLPVADPADCLLPFARTVLSLIGHLTLLILFTLSSWAYSYVKTFNQKPIRLDEYQSVPRDEDEEERLAGFCLSPGYVECVVDVRHPRSPAQQEK